MNRDSVSRIRMFFREESSSGKAVRFCDAPRAKDVKRSEWIPRSLIDRLTKFPKGAGHDYPEVEFQIPSWLCEQKSLGPFEQS